MRGSRVTRRSLGDNVGRNAMGIVRSSRVVGGVASRVGGGSTGVCLGRLMRRVSLILA